jgi:very-short-patch-repair endonuclease
MLRRVIAENQVGFGVTNREFEARFFEFIVENRLPMPVINQPVTVGIETFVVDFAWPQARLIVETDGNAFHSTPAKRATDKRRDRRLSSIGWRVIRVAWAHLRDDGAELAADLRASIAP